MSLQDLERAPALFKRALGAGFARLPAAIRELHSPRGRTLFEGIAQVDAAETWVGALFARLFRFPAAATGVAVEVAIEPQVGRETWRRRFGTSGCASTLWIDSRTGQLTERFALVRFALVVKSHEQGIDMSITGARLGILPLPRMLVPWTRAQERVDEQGRFTFDVESGMRGVGRLVRYRGWLVPLRGESASLPSVTSTAAVT